MHTEGAESPHGRRRRKSGRRLLLAALLLLAVAGVAGAGGVIYGLAWLTAAPPPLYPQAVRTTHLGDDLTAYTTPASFSQVLQHYARGAASMGTNVAQSSGFPFVGEVERLLLTPAPPDRNVEQAVFIHRANRLTTWTFIARGRNASFTRIVTGLRMDERPRNVRMGANLTALDDWTHPRWGGRDTVMVGGLVAGTCLLSAPFPETWRSHSSLAAVPRDYAPGLTSAVAPPTSANGGTRPAVFWTGDESDPLRIAVFRRFEPGWGSLAFLTAEPSGKGTRMFLVTLLN